MREKLLKILDKVCYFGLLLWVLLKMFGVINTPLWLQYSPLLGVIYLAGRYSNKLDMVVLRVDRMDIRFDKRLEKVENKLDCIDKDVHIVKSRCSLFK